MITPITFCSTQSKTTPKKNNNISAQLCTSATAVAGGALGGYGIKEYINSKNGAEQKIESEKLKIKCEMLDRKSSIIDECITNSDYIRELTTPPDSECEMYFRGLDTLDILTESEKKAYRNTVEGLTKDTTSVIKQSEEQLDNLVDHYIRQSDFAKQHPHETPYTLKEVGDLNLTMKDILPKEKYEEYFKSYNLEQQKIRLLKDSVDSQKDQRALYAIKDSNYFKNIKKTYSLNDLKEMGKDLNDILSSSECQSLSEKLSAEENKFKEIEKQTIEKLKAELKNSKRKNLYMMGGAGVGIFLLSVLSLLNISQRSK